VADPRLDDFVARARVLRQRDVLDRAAVAALAALERAEVDAVLLKGPALARRLYAEGEVRGYSDIDLLIPRQGLVPARDVLTQLGYVRADAVFGIDDVAGIQHSEVWSRPGERESRSGPIMIDLHWRLDGCEAPDDLMWEALAAQRGSIELRGRKAPVLRDEGLALHVALHVAQHGPGDVKAIGDLARAVERWPADVWRRAARLAEAVHGVPAFAAGLRLVPDGAKLANELRMPPTPELDWKIQTREVRPRGTFHIQAWAEADGLGRRLDVVRRSLFPSRLWIEWEFRWAADGGARLALAYACHILRAPLWAVRAGRYLLRARRAGRRG
jgi:Uncharacterised nucleotidyltransferase